MFKEILSFVLNKRVFELLEEYWEIVKENVGISLPTTMRS